MSRCFDLLIAAVAAFILAAPILVVAVAVRLTSPGPVLYWSSRVGRDNELFRMPKFRTMRVGTPAVASHLLQDPKSAMTPIGGFLRRTSLDELPQLWSVIRGHMALVGPRPALFNQDDLVALRTQAGVHRLKPGITGWAQIMGRDAVTNSQKAALDHEYLVRKSLSFDIAILVRTVFKLFGDQSVSH